MNLSAPKRLYLGCGPSPFHIQHRELMAQFGPEEEWVNIDKYVKQEGVLNYDAESLPYQKDSIDTIYASHLLEHIEYSKVIQVIKHWHDLLKKGGMLIINVPDLQWLCKKFLELCDKPDPQQYYGSPVDFFRPEHSLLEPIFGSQYQPGEYHKSGFTVDALKNVLTSVGFSIDAITTKVDAHTIGCIIVRAQK